MTDIYLHQSSSKKKWIAAAVLLGLVVSAAIWKQTRTPPEENTVTTDIPADSKTSTTSKKTSKTASAPAPDPQGNRPRDISAELAGIRETLDSGNLSAGRESGLSLLESLTDHPARGEVESLLGDLHIRMMFSAAEMPEKTRHIVKSGDTLGKLAQTYDTTTELIAESNGLRNNVIRLGSALKIPDGEFSAVVSKSRNDLELRLNNRFFKRYRVGTGTDSSTPAGNYVITLRMRHPVWYRPDGESFPYGHPENLLGTHYLKLNTPGIGLHGTWEPESVGSQSSAGCVRLENEMIEELYKLLPEGTSVRIID